MKKTRTYTQEYHSANDIKDFIERAIANGAQSIMIEPHVENMNGYYKITSVFEKELSAKVRDSLFS